MFIKERMSTPVISVPPSMPINDALNLMKDKHIRRLPVIQNEKLVGIVSDIDLMNASPSMATSLSVWEMNYLVSKITVKDVMTKKVFTLEEDTPIEAAARIMADNKIGGMPVLRDGKVVGIITETDLFKILLELMGARKVGVRVTLLMHEQPGLLARLSQAIAQNGGNFIAFGAFSGEDPATRIVTFKLEGIDIEQTTKLMAELGEKLIDIRMC